MKLDKDSHVLICAPVGGVPVGGEYEHIEGTIESTCDDCGSGIYLAPSGQRMRAEGKYALCFWCALRAMAEHGGEIHPPTDDQRRELEHDRLKEFL